MSSNRGRPRKEASKRLEERICVRLTEKDKQVLKQVAEHKGIAPEALARTYILPFLRKDLQELAKDSESTLFA